MKNLFPILALIISQAASADPLGDHLAKMRTVIEKDDRCEFAVVTIPTKRDQKALWPTGAVCVGTVGFNMGTMREKVGCTAFYLDANQLLQSSLMPNLDYNMAEGKKCRQGGFEAVMDDLLFTDNTVSPKKRVPVKWAFSSPYRLPDSGFDVQLIFTGKYLGKFRDWFEKERSAYREELSKRKK